MEKPQLPHTPRRPISFTNLTPAKRRHLLRRLKYAFPLSPHHSPDMPHPRRARIRICLKEVRQRAKQLKEVRRLTQLVEDFERDERGTALFTIVARLHNISVAIPTNEFFENHRQYIRLTQKPPTHTLHVGRLNRPPIDPQVLARSFNKRKRRKSGNSQT